MRFNKSNLPINNDMLNFWNENGYLIIENFKTEEECNSLIQRSKELIDCIYFKVAFISSYGTISISNICF